MAAHLTTLRALNIVLSNIGMAAVTEIDNDNPMVVMASNTIEEVSSSVQSEGWVFNTEKDYPFTPDQTTNNIAIPSNVLELDTDYYSDLDVVIRGGKLYDKRAHTFTFTDQLDLDVTWLIDFDDVPPAFQQYITMRSANLFAGRAVGSAESVKFGEREEAQARAAMMNSETEQGDYNVFAQRTARNYSTYHPTNVTLRY